MINDCTRRKRLRNSLVNREWGMRSQMILQQIVDKNLDAKVRNKGVKKRLRDDLVKRRTLGEARKEDMFKMR